MKTNVKKIILIITPILLSAVVILLFLIYQKNPDKSVELDIELFKGLLQFGIFGLLTILVKFIYEETVLKIKKEEEIAFKKFEIRKASLDALVDKRIEAFQAFWNISEQLRDPALNNKNALIKLKKWYFDEGFGMFISHATMKHYMFTKHTLGNMNPDFDAREKLMSKMRTRLKVDIGVYTEEESAIPTKIEEIKQNEI